jgi:hypothetical protein
MAKPTTFSNDILKLIFNAVAIANLANNASSAPATVLSVALHTADPGSGGDQTTNEIAYTGYSRVNVTRGSGGWTVSGASVSPAANIDFGVMTGGAGGTVTHVSVGTGTSDKMLYSGTLTPSIVVVNGVTPRVGTGSTITEG